MESFEDKLFQQLAYTCAEAKQAYSQYIGMSQARLQLLTFLAQQGEISHAALQQRLLLDGATITRLVKQFEAEGVLSRRLDPQDNRYTLVTLTPSGQQIVAGLQETHSLFQAKLLEGISREEQEVMMRVLERLRTNIRDGQEVSHEQE
ncbi:MAG TPA: MarR family transcriptional regulator [Ktedonosporobacter sp.]|nr:MarR family transcriptional regulator [Ktedonosporobacter sp.]